MKCILSDGEASRSTHQALTRQNPACSKARTDGSSLSVLRRNERNKSINISLSVYPYVSIHRHHSIRLHNAVDWVRPINLVLPWLLVRPNKTHPTETI